MEALLGSRMGWEVEGFVSKEGKQRRGKLECWGWLCGDEGL